MTERFRAEKFDYPFGYAEEAVMIIDSEASGSGGPAVIGIMFPEAGEVDYSELFMASLNARLYEFDCSKCGRASSVMMRDDMPLHDLLCDYGYAVSDDLEIIECCYQPPDIPGRYDEGPQ